MLPLTIWMNMPSFHQEDLFVELASTGEVDLRVVFARAMTARRRQLGWSAKLVGYNHHTLATPRAVFEASRIAWRERERLHIISGSWAELTFMFAMSVLRIAKSRVAIYAEGPSSYESHSAVKEAFKRSFGRWLSRAETTLLLSVSQFSSTFYRQLGFAENRIYPFGYFQQAYDGSLSGPIPENSLEVVFVGQLIHLKGVDILLQAMKQLFTDYPGLHLTFIGDGAFKPALQRAVRQEAIATHVTFEGTVPSSQIRNRIAQAALLVLPSRWDGWGMVVNEAFSVGVPVIVSDRCGAMDLVQHGVNGYIFRSEDVEDLRRCLRDFLDHPGDWARFRAAAANMGRKISAQSAARYLVECLRHMIEQTAEKPVAPWLENPGIGEAEVR